MLRLYLYARVRFSFALLHTRPRVQQAPGIPCALDRAKNSPINSGAVCRGDAKACLSSVIASEAKQSISQRKENMDCFAALAMTWTGRRHPLNRHHPRMRVIQYSRGVRELTARPRRTGYPAFAGYDGQGETTNKK